MSFTPEELEELRKSNPSRTYSKRLQPYEPIKGELWIDIPGTIPVGIYAMSSLGRIRKTLITSAGKYISAIMRPNIINNRLLIGLTMQPECNSKKIYVHTLVLRLFKPQDDMDIKFCLFKDGNTSNCELSNLSWATKHECSQHMMNLGLRQRKLKTRPFINIHGRKGYKLTQFSEKDLEKIIELYASGLNQNAIAKLMKCTQSWVSLVVNKRIR